MRANLIRRRDFCYNLQCLNTSVQILHDGAFAIVNIVPEITSRLSDKLVPYLTRKHNFSKTFLLSNFFNGTVHSLFIGSLSNPKNIWFGNIQRIKFR
jgi:hypothetical protein